MSEPVQPDVALGSWVYCKSHRRPHSTGWCSVDVKNKLPLGATTREGAYAEVKARGLPIHGHCEQCYRLVANEDWYLKGQRRCPDHEEAA